MYITEVSLPSFANGVPKILQRKEKFIFFGKIYLRRLWPRFQGTEKKLFYILEIEEVTW